MKLSNTKRKKKKNSKEKLKTNNQNIEILQNEFKIQEMSL